MAAGPSRLAAQEEVAVAGSPGWGRLTIQSVTRSASQTKGLCQSSEDLPPRLLGGTSNTLMTPRSGRFDLEDFDSIEIWAKR